MAGSDWIAVDWGTTHLRAYAMRGAEMRAEVASEQGMNALEPHEFEPALLHLIGPWLTDQTVRVICCGMVGARQGWREAPYRKVPCAPVAELGAPVATKDPRLRVHILPGLSQMHPADVMRGEETQIAGFITLNPHWDGVLVMPGTHSKWVQISAGEVVSFQTCMTGELFALLSERSVLRHSLSGGDQIEAEAFEAAVSDTLSKPESLATRLFRLRAAEFLHGVNPATTRAMLSGLLIGAELAATRPFWLGQSVTVIGGGHLTALYVQALSAQGVPAGQARADAMTRAGLHAAYRTLEAAQ